MKRRMYLYKIVDQNGKQVFEDLLTAKQVTEKTGCTKNNVAQAAANFALVNKKYRIIPEDIKLSKALDVELLAEWDRYRKWMLRRQGGKYEQETEKETVQQKMRIPACKASTQFPDVGIPILHRYRSSNIQTHLHRENPRQSEVLDKHQKRREF